MSSAPTAHADGIPTAHGSASLLTRQVSQVAAEEGRKLISTVMQGSAGAAARRRPYPSHDARQPSHEQPPDQSNWRARMPPGSSGRRPSRE
jgi:hypothetical protein